MKGKHFTRSGGAYQAVQRFGVWGVVWSVQGQFSGGMVKRFGCREDAMRAADEWNRGGTWRQRQKREPVAPNMGGAERRYRRVRAERESIAASPGGGAGAEGRG